MDDFVVWASSKDAINELLIAINQYVESNLALRLKEPVCGHTKYGLPFLGFLIKENGIYLTQKSKRRVTERIRSINESFFKNEITEEKAAERALSVFAAINLARTRCLRMALNKEGEQPLAPTARNGGGSWNNNAQDLRSANRNNNNTPSNRNNNLGFRLVRGGH
jgi:hypothetical protein